jgi:hypothetical protein
MQIEGRDALPTRERIAALIENLRVDCNCGAVDIGVGILHEPRCGEPSSEDMTDAILALLQPAWEDQKTIIGLQRAAIDVWKKAHPHEQSPGACAIALNALRADLRACVEALEPFAYPTVAGDTFLVSGKEVNAAREVLARPGVKDIK